MNNPLTQHGEFIPATQEQAKAKPSIDSRQHSRHSLREDNDSNIVLACDGVTISLFKPTWRGAKAIGIANIKDVGLGGVGMISRCKLTPNQQLSITVDDELIPIIVMRVQIINEKLNFIGAKWGIEDQESSLHIIKRIQFLSKKSV